MNKLQGFYVLQNSNLPSVPWKKYYGNDEFDPNILWTVRSAVKDGDDFHLPRKVGVSANEAKEFASELYKKLGTEDMVIFYPYFIALKSGVIDITNKRVVIEAVKNDLWNLVTNNKTDVTIIFEADDLRIIGDEYFLSQDELVTLIEYCKLIKKKFSQEINIGKNVILEWSFANKSNISKQAIGDTKLVFYEIRTV